MAGLHLGNRTRFTTVHITAFVASLAALTGCATNKVGSYKAPNQHTDAQQANLSNAHLDPAVMNGDQTLASYQDKAREVGLPQEHLTEAQVLTAETQARRAAAQSAELTAQANLNEGFANADADLQANMTENEISHAGAERLAAVYNAKLEEMNARAAAAEIGARVEYKRQDDLLGAAVKEWRSEVEKLQAQANADWVASQAEYDRMIVERASVETRGRKQIEHMTNVVQRTTDRADAKVRALRTEAMTTTEQTAARVAEVRQQLSTVRDATGANVSEYRQRSQSERESGFARAAELRARATAIEEQDVDETFRLNLSAAENAFAAAKAEAERLFQQADALNEQLEGEYTRKFSQASQQALIDQADFDEAIKSVDSFVEHGKGEVALLRVNADVVERQARSSFVKAEAEARANAVYESARHQITLAEQEAARFAAEAEAEAARVQAEYFQNLARQTKANKVTMPSAAGAQNQGASSSDTNPEFTQVQDNGASIDPNHVAAFKAALAQAVKLREQADAQERALFAAAEEKRTSFNTWFAQRNAANDQAISEANIYKSQTLAQIDTYRAQAQSMLDQSTAQLGSAKMEAEAQRRESIAQMTSLIAEADALEKKATANQTQFAAKASAMERSGDSELRSLEVVLDSTQRQGDALAARLNAEAESLAKSQAAVVAQMNSEITAANQILESELAKLDQAAESYINIAKADYDERCSEVAMLDAVNDATRTELAANNTAQQETTLADVGLLRDTNLANTLIAQAAVARVIANADADLNVSNATNTITRAALIAQNQMSGASVSEQFQIAGAEDRFTSALFDARITSTLSQRDRAYATQYLANAQSNLRESQAVSSAAAYAELSSKALAILNQRIQAFDQAAQRNWASALAHPEPMPQPYGADYLNNQAEQIYNLDSIANVSDENEPAPNDNN